MNWSYRDRRHAGQILADELIELKEWFNPLILAIPNGGVAVAAPIAERLNAQLDILIVRKLQIPYNPEAGFGALTSLGTMILNDDLVKRIGLSKIDIVAVRDQTLRQIENRKEAYSGLAAIEDPQGRDVILVDDGLASGFTMVAALESVKMAEPAGITVAVPTSSGSAAPRVEPLVDHLVCPRIESGFVFAVANAYENWYDVPDSEVIELLHSFHNDEKQLA
ncbi:MAG: phosphoribosyltransferase [Candidatus Thorarchaeota archaeon]|nr:MAG: phosphoribosyltransferase [Candidatus Thorarchaeota archaeon]